MVAAVFGHICSEVRRLAGHLILAQTAGMFFCLQKHKPADPPTPPPRDKGTVGQLPVVMFVGGPTGSPTSALLSWADMMNDVWLPHAGNRVCLGGLGVVQSESGTSRAAVWEVPLALRPSTAQALAPLRRRERDASSTHDKEAALRQRLQAIRYEMVMEMSQGGHPDAEQTSLSFVLQQAKSTHSTPQRSARSYLPSPVRKTQPLPLPIKQNFKVLVAK